MIHADGETPKLARAREAVQFIGLGLDHQVFPTVANGGRILAHAYAGRQLDVGKENRNAEQQRGSAAGSWKGSARREGATRGSRTSSPAPQVIFRRSKEDYASALEELVVAYPGSQMWFEKDGIWLVAPSVIVQGLDRHAVFIVAIPFDLSARAQGWGFWSRGNLAFAQWIGPRHTNFPHGSICAFDQHDRVWETGHDPTLLLDLYTVWAARHLFLDFFGRWPGSQTARWPFERLLECRHDELCACGSLTATYGECCLKPDRDSDQVRDAVSFLLDTNGGHRSPPEKVVEFLRSQSTPPSLTRYL